MFFVPSPSYRTLKASSFSKNHHVLAYLTTIFQDDSQPMMFCQCLSAFMSVSQADTQPLSALANTILILE